MNDSAPASLELRNVGVTVDQREVLRNIDLGVLPGELFAVMGGADAGKSAILHAVAGIDPIQTGEIWIDDMPVSALPPQRRGVALLLQNFPLWPHMSVADNVAFGLRQRHLRRRDLRRRVERELAMVGLTEFARHRPWQLSASQRQRVALARTLAAGARINLLDEPLSAQDLQLRARLLRGLKKRQQQDSVTTLFTTQDRDEALRVADRIALLQHGELQQVGTPVDLYDLPCNRYVAEYMGCANLLDGEVEHADGRTLFRAANGIVIPLLDDALRRSRTGCAMLRPRELYPVSNDTITPAGKVRFSGRIDQTEFLGDRWRFCIDVAGTTVWMDLPRSGDSTALNIGDQLTVELDPGRVRVLDN